MAPGRSDIEEAFLRLAQRTWPADFARESSEVSWLALDEDEAAACPAWLVARDAFLSMLDPVIRGRDEQGARYGIQFYNEAMQWPDSKRLYRLQALQTYPWIWLDLGLSRPRRDRNFMRHRRWYEPRPRAQTDPHWPTLQAVDQGASLAPILCQRYDVSRSALRSLAHYGRIDDPFQAAPLLWILDIMKPDHRPSCFADLKAILQWATRWGWSEDRQLMETWARELLRDGVSTARSRLRKWAPSHSHRSLESCLKDLSDYLRHVVIAGNDAKAGVIPWHQGQGTREGSLRGLFEASETWHSLTAKAKPTPTKIQWPPRMRTPLRIGEYLIQELTSSQQLNEEGQAMKHCVASYVEDCLTGQSIILSVRDEQGRRWSTLQLGQEPPGCWMVIQHRGVANQSVPAQLVALEKSLLEHIRQT